MKKSDMMQMPVHDESPPVNIGRVDITPKSGFIIEIDGRLKNRFDSESDAIAEAVQLKARFPKIQVKIYDAVEMTRAVVSADGVEPADAGHVAGADEVV
jgi:hypothetical protein